MKNDVLKNIEKLKKISPEKWEKICKNCGLCCFVKYTQDDNIEYSNTICEHYDLKNKRCAIYETRFNGCGSCQKVNLEMILAANFLPASCGYMECVFGPAKIVPKIDFSKIKNHNPGDFKTRKQIDKSIIPGSDSWNKTD